MAELYVKQEKALKILRKDGEILSFLLPIFIANVV